MSRNETAEGPRFVRYWTGTRIQSPKSREGGGAVPELDQGHPGMQTGLGIAMVPSGSLSHVSVGPCGLSRERPTSDRCMWPCRETKSKTRSSKIVEAGICPGQGGDSEM